jgi:uncharacterized repeat protein (TIGR01451 family)
MGRRLFVRLAALLALLPVAQIAQVASAPPAAAALPAAYVVDPAVNNTVANFATSDTKGGSEPSGALNPANPQQAVMTSFSFGWGTNAPLWYTGDGGQTWTKEFSIPAPPGRPTGCPCDQTVDYGRNGTLFGTFLINNPGGGDDIASGSTTDPTQASSWSWNGNPAQLTNPDGSNPGITDQPWIIVNRDSTTAANDDAFVSWDELGGAQNARVEASLNSAPPNFTRDQSIGSQTPGNGCNGSPRLAKDTRNGWMYALWQTSSNCGASPKTVTLHLDRTQDSNQSWTLNGNAGGITVSSTFSQDEYDYSFGQANTLQGGVHHVAVDPTNGDVYVVFGRDDDGATTTQRNTMYIDRLVYDGGGNLNVAAGYPKAVSTSHDTALPSVAVASDGTVGVLYDTFDGTSGGFPQFSAHLARSTDHGATFQDDVLKQFLAPTVGTGTQGRRDLGDYQQIKAEGTTIYGVFSGNRQAFNASANNVIDPIYFSTSTPTADLSITKSASPNPVVAGTDLTYQIAVTNNGSYTALSPTMTDTIPVNTTINSITSPVDWTCLAGPPISCNAPNGLAPGITKNFVISVHVSPSAPDGSTISNTATVSSSTSDPNIANNSSPATVNVVAQADLATTKTGPTQVTPGTNATYNMTLKNNGPSDAQNATLSDTTAPGTVFVSETHPAGFNCVDPAVGSPGTMTCTKPGGLSPGPTVYAFSITVHVSPAAAGTNVNNTATASSTTTDVVPLNNSATQITAATCDHIITGNLTSSQTVSGTGSWCFVNVTSTSGLTIQPGPLVIITGSTFGGTISATGPAGFDLCNSTTKGVNVSRATGFVLLGDPADDLCPTNTINGSVSLSGNTGGVEVGHNSISGGLSLVNNSGTGPFPLDDNRPEVEGNSITGALSCSGNVPGVTNDGQINTAASKSGQCAAL